MKNVSFHVLLLFLQIFLVSNLITGDLIKTKSGKVFLRRSSKKEISSGDVIKPKSGKGFVRRSSKKEISSKKDTEEGGHSQLCFRCTVDLNQNVKLLLAQDIICALPLLCTQLLIKTQCI